MEIRRVAASIGAEISDVAICDTGSLDLAALRQAWLDHGVLLFRGQYMTPTALAHFSACFGELEPPPASEAGTREELGGQPVWYISNVVENGKLHYPAGQTELFGE